MQIVRRTIAILVIIFLVASSTVFVFFQHHQRPLVSHILKSIPIEERKTLEWFFRMVIAGDTFGYALFGQKPIAVCVLGEPMAEVYWVEDWIDHIPTSLCHENLKMIQGWEVWKKYQHLFPSRNFAFFVSENFVDNGMKALVFMNKKAFLKTVKENWCDFKSVLGEAITPESLMEEVLCSSDVFGAVLKHHQGLIGIVLGYGRHNAWLYHEREVIWKKIAVEKKKLTDEDLKEYARLNQLLQPFRQGTAADLNSFSLGLPYFVADLQHPETRRLKLEYERTFRKMMNSYAHRDFLEVTLGQLTAAN